jgi:DNA-binding IclR family transcriptional regulator
VSPRKRASAAAELWSNPELREPRYSQSLERGLAILGCFTPARPVLGIADIADDLGMSRSTTHRYVITLLALGYLEWDASRKYRLGLRVTGLGAVSESRPWAGCGTHGRPATVQLSKRHVEPVAGEVPSGGSLLWVLSGVPGPRDTFEAATRGRSRQVAKSLISGLSLLECMPIDGRYVRRAELARILGMKGNVAGRYLYTLLGTGLLEQDSRTRRYRIASRVSLEVLVGGLRQRRGR